MQESTAGHTKVAYCVPVVRIQPSTLVSRAVDQVLFMIADALKQIQRLFDSVAV